MSVDRVLRIVLHELVHRLERLWTNAVDAVLDADAEVLVAIGRLQRDRVSTDLKQTVRQDLRS